MSELKTLRDLYSEDSTWNMGEMVSMKDLKAEATKRWKYYQNLIENYEPSKNTIDWTIQIFQAKQEEIVEFFNLTEADLQGDKT